MIKEDVMRVCQLYRDGKMCRQIAQILGKHEDTIRRALKRSGIKTRSYRDYSAAKVNDDYFRVIDTEAKAYWLGFIAADGRSIW